MAIKVYLVGGAVRDHYLYRESKDRDYVVTGSTPEEMDAINGLRRIGKDFPVWIDGNGNEYALARDDRVSNFRHFNPNTSIEEDLMKRDLTINAMALDSIKDQREQRIGDEWVPQEAMSYLKLIDPCNGYQDLQAQVLRMTSPDSFWDDPIRVLRVARFAARFPDFTIDPATFEVMTAIANSGGLRDAQPERVWKELSRGLMEIMPGRMINVLHSCGALKAILPEVDALYGVPQPEQHHPEIDTGKHIEQCLEIAAELKKPLEVRFAVLMHDVGKAVTPLHKLPSHPGHEGEGVPIVEIVCNRLRVPNHIRKVAVAVTREHLNFHQARNIKVATLVKLLRRCDAFRNPTLFTLMIDAAECDARGRWGATADHSYRSYKPRIRIENALKVALSLKVGGVAEQYKDRPEFIATAVHAYRARAIRAAERNNQQ